MVGTEFDDKKPLNPHQVPSLSGVGGGGSEFTLTGALLALKITGHDVKRRIANQFSFVSLQQNSPFDVMSSNFK